MNKIGVIQMKATTTACTSVETPRSYCLHEFVIYDVKMNAHLLDHSRLKERLLLSVSSPCIWFYK